MSGSMIIAIKRPAARVGLAKLAEIGLAANGLSALSFESFARM
jgi:hypothetical protein